MTCDVVSQEKTGLIIHARPLLLFVTISKFYQTETVKKRRCVEKGELMLAISLLSSINLSKTTDMQLLGTIKHILRYNFLEIFINQL